MTTDAVLLADSRATGAVEPLCLRAPEAQDAGRFNALLSETKSSALTDATVEEL